MRLYEYRMSVVRVVDGDTLVVSCDLGLHCFHTESLRVVGVNAPELFSGDAREAGRAARDFVIGWVADATANAPDAVWPFQVETIKDRQTFGRYVAHIVRQDTGASLADALVEAGHAVRSTG